MDTDSTDIRLSVDAGFLTPPPPRFVSIHGLCRTTVHLKLEGLNVAGSIKLKTALQLVEDFEREGRIAADTELIESSSGNLGVALSMVCANRGYRFTCVVDPNTSEYAIRIMHSMGARVIPVTKRDSAGGFLGTRIALIRSMAAGDRRVLWLNQYANASNWRAHYRWTGPEILKAFPSPDYVFIGAGTTGTLMGCARYLKARSPRTRIVAVDSVGSVTFGTPAARRLIPGLGTSRKPELCDASMPDAVVHVREEDTIRCCRELAACGLLAGGSTGTVLSAVRGMADRLDSTQTIVALSPDMGEKYLDSIYADDWVEGHYDLRVASPSTLNQIA
ncbi:putative siderophore biosynthesis protein SbnA [Pandoraea terrae]|uniref:Putative siderophore biosynthesis protein SbnA n=1 Tax=Pandoraea terrae TaxID=1537710 RepID=A0A5E4YB69_9BURK|nr:2,3-diaminopropionate biosynthesis protein SbnA [Pandoraea terrae]VVE45946.1 putative siderophore biosynthesis protein SbnA [Pandoraea terrae]